MLSNDEWIEHNFENANLTDKRLSRRLCKIGKAIVNRPEASFPKQIPNWGDLKAAYRFFSNPHVTHKRIQEPHRKKVMDSTKTPKTVHLFYQDTSELDYSHLKNTELGPIGNHFKMQGIMTHNCLTVQCNGTNRNIIGLAHQQVWIREDVCLNRIETRHQRNKREDKESTVWSKTLKALKSPPEDCVWVSIGDRASDIYEYHQQVMDSKWQSLIRACQDRAIQVKEEKDTLLRWARSLPTMGERAINFRRKNDTTKKDVTLKIAWGLIKILPPARMGKKASPISLWVIRTWNDEEELDWVLLSTIPVNNLPEAVEKIEWYTGRWLIEEFHKCLKTGCKIELRQLETSKSLINYIGIASVIAVLMLYLRELARQEPDSLASKTVPIPAIKIICKKYNLQSESLTLGLFWKSVAKFGGFIGRKSDGEPGWQTLWQGWIRLLDMLWAIEALDLSLG